MHLSDNLHGSTFRRIGPASDIAHSCSTKQGRTLYCNKERGTVIIHVHLLAIS